MVVFVSLPAAAHPGGVDRNGGHWNHKTDEYHCHRAGCSPPPCDANRGEHRCGNRYYGEGSYAPKKRSPSKSWLSW